MNLGHCAEMAVKMERGFCGNPLKLKLISETTAPHSIRSEAKIEDSATQTTSTVISIYMHTRVLFPGR